MSTKLLRMLGTLLVAVGLIAGTLGTAVAGTDGLDVDVLNPDGEIATDGGDGGDGGDTGTQTGGGDNDNGNTQDNTQDQTQTPDQNQTATQGNDNELDQDNALDAVVGGAASGDCAIVQPDDGDAADDEVVDEPEADDTVAGEEDDVINGDDDACTLGDSTVGDANIGDTTHANVGDADASNASSQNQESGDQGNVNAPEHANEQDLTNELDADAGDGAAGGAAINSGSVDITSDIVATLVRIMASIIGDDNQTTVIIEDDDPAPTCDTITIVLTWGGDDNDLDAHLSGPDTGGGRFHVYYDNMTQGSYAWLDRDDTHSPGTEMVTVTSPTGDGAFVAGEYRYWVDVFPDSYFRGSGAVVTVQCDGQQLAQFSVAGASGNSEPPLWHVFNLRLTATGEVTITPVQLFKPGDTDTEL